MIKIKFNKRRLVIVLIVVFMVGVSGLTIYEHMELKGLRARVHSIEFQAQEEAAAMNDANQNAQNEKVDYQVVSKTTANIRVQDMQPYTEGQSTSPAYVTKKATVYKLKITNNTSMEYNYYEGEIKGRTANGTLIAPTSDYLIHPEDKLGKETLSLAPGGSAEFSIAIVTDEEIIDLYYASNSGM